MLTAWRRFARDDRGAELVEYAVLATVVGLGAVEAISVFVLGLDGLFAPVTAAIASFIP